MKKYAPRKVFILENGEYIEITNDEHESRVESDLTYANRFFIPVQGYLLEVDQEHYEDFYRTKDRLGRNISQFPQGNYFTFGASRIFH